ncbi:MAG: phosphoribosylaminoimidazolesuccinocarboxamide synthase, partial [Thermoplasmata archaeon]
NRMRVHKVQVLDPSKLTRKSTNFLVPLEVICRYYVAGSLWDRVRSGEVKPSKLGFKGNKDIKYGDELPEPFVEVTTKLEEHDRLLTKTEAMKMASVSVDEYKAMIDSVTQIDERIADEVGKRDLIHVDGKQEFAFDENRELMVVDTFGTADEDRWWDDTAYSKGEFVELSKELVRQYYREKGYYSKLTEARKQGRPEPKIPALPADKIKKVSDLYVDMFERITGESYR